MKDEIGNEVCDDCGGWDIEWMKHCPSHPGVPFCRGCECPYCRDEEDVEDFCRDHGDWEIDPDMRRHTEAVEIIVEKARQIKKKLIASLEEGDREEQRQYELLRQYHSLVDSTATLTENREATERGEK